MAKPITAKSPLDRKIAALALRTGHKTLATWACDCAKRVLPYFENEYPDDARPRLAIAAGRRWVKTDVFRMADIRKASLDAHAAARKADEHSPARSAARAAGHSVATAHVRTHSIAAAIYAATARRNATDDAHAEAAVAKERAWQYRRLLTLRTRKRRSQP